MEKKLLSTAGKFLRHIPVHVQVPQATEHMLQSVRLRPSSEINRKKKIYDGVEGMGAKNRIWYRRKEPRRVKTEDHEAQLAAS